MRRDAVSGTLLIVGALAGVLVMALHPTGREVLDAANPPQQAHFAAAVHALAIAAQPIVFLGLLGLSRRLGHSDLTTAALVVYGLGAVAVLSAAVMSGFVASGMMLHVLAAEGTARETYETLLSYSGHVNQGYAGVYVVATSVAIVGWSVAMLRSRTLGRAAAYLGLAVGAAVPVAFFAGHLRLDVHGFGLVVVAQAAWMVWVGVLLWRDARPTGS